MLPEETYHFFNHANGPENLFVEERNYFFFLKKLALHILPVAKVYAYCLMPNHFHFIGSIRSEDELLKLFKGLPNQKDLLKSSDTFQRLTYEKIEKKISKAFSNLFSCYTQSFNKVYKRRGSLFIPSMKKEPITDDNSFCKVIHYIHANPIHHGFVNKIDSWPYSSYKIFLSKSGTKIERFCTGFIWWVGSIY